VHALITERDVRTLRALTGALAQELFERDRRRAGYVAGIGIFRAWYEPGAERLLNALNGRAVRIDRRACATSPSCPGSSGRRPRPACSAPSSVSGAEFCWCRC